MKQYPFLDLKASNLQMEEELKEAACKTIESGRYLHGEDTQLLEKEIADFCQCKFCVAVSNGLDALRLILRAYQEMGVMQKGDKVIVPANTYIATILAVSDNDMIPVLCEPSEDTMNLNSHNIDALITDDVKAIMPVHLYGTPCWNGHLKQLAQQHSIKIIEDNAQAIGAESDVTGLNGTTKTGGLGDASGVSFYPTKNLGALGDAGAVTTNDEELAGVVKALANYGSDRRYHNIYRGFNCRIDEIQAAMLRVKLRYLDDEKVKRNAIANTYGNHITNPLVKTPTIFENMTQVWHQYVVRAKNRNNFRKYLNENGIGSDIHYATPPHLQPCYQEWKDAKFPITERLANEVVSLPIANISTTDAIEIATIINNYQG